MGSFLEVSLLDYPWYWATAATGKQDSLATYRENIASHFFLKFVYYLVLEVSLWKTDGCLLLFKQFSSQSA